MHPTPPHTPCPGQLPPHAQASRSPHGPTPATCPTPAGNSSAPTLEAWRQARNGIRKPTHDPRALMNAILYVDRTGIPWRYLPHDFPPHQTVYGYFAHWEADGIFDQLTGLLRGKVRQAEGRTSEPSACLIDSQSIKTSATVPLASQGIDPAKKIIGRKRHIVTDMLGPLLAVAVTAASVHDSAAGPPLRQRLRTPPHHQQSLDRQRLQDQSRRTRSPPRHRPRNRPTRPQHTRLSCPAPPLGHEPKSTC
ncbi:hypothetical protein GCM10010344_01390 [Streptomyces bluensis]|nr:hypothetical protein GCM10010344_01390 [Streptomyces bluensis]